MSFLNKMVGAFRSNIKNDSGGFTLSDVNALFFNNRIGTDGPDISEITYFICMKKLSESLGKMPIALKDSDKNRITDHNTYQYLNVQPNAVLTPAQFFTSLEYCRNHYGNGYAYINRNPDGSMEGLYILDPRMVQIWVNNTSQFTQRQYYYFYTDSVSGQSYWFYPDDVIHVKSWKLGRNGFAGKSVREILASYMQGNKASQRFLNDLYQKGLTANAVVKYTGDLDKKSMQNVIAQLTELAGQRTDRIIPLPPNWDIVPLELKLTDSQFYELKKFSSLQVAAAFGIMPNHLNNYDKSSYANSSMQNLTFYVDTLLYNITLYEQELNRKLLTTKELQQGLGYEFNVSVILRGDPASQADMLNKYVAGSVYSVNEARRYAGMPPDKDGNVIIANGSYVKLQDLGSAYKNKAIPKGGEDGK
ncbi:phage portal protein [Pectinatus haikarae]|uniref:HK97 family phage portal protein n=1 Tax=Pectinatus haikarae TaxID=349096 RepID=A0ABT9Y979_9FIRM|nr:phage portal protein [Pectinatus haikarae]MDQ0204076.1 HK97 family phage portal protein [Pectinatus haikarae]